MHGAFSLDASEVRLVERVLPKHLQVSILTPDKRPEIIPSWLIRDFSCIYDESRSNCVFVTHISLPE